MLFYHNRPGFNYLKYLEDKSHFDGLKISIRNDIKDLVSSDRELSQNHISVARDISESISDSTDRIVSSLDSGFSNLAVSIDDVRSSVDNLSSICEIGFSVLDLHLTNLNESIRELVRIAKTPDQTWAFEQFEIARDAYRRNLYEESLEYIDRAIDGYKDRSGFKLEHRFHLLRGHIHLGNERNYSLKLVNLNLAYDDFINAAKYAEYDHKPAMAKAMQLAGWTSYCSGNIEKAEKHLLDSLSTESNSETAFILSKTLLHKGDLDRGIPYFSRAIRGDFKFALRAGGDEDFLKYDSNLKREIEIYRTEILESVGQKKTVYLSLDARNSFEIITDYRLGDDKNLIDNVESLLSKSERAPVSDLLRIESDLSKFLTELRDLISTIKYSMMLDADKLDKFDFKKSKFEEPWPVIFVLGIIVSFLTYNWMLSDGIGPSDLAQFFERLLAAIVAIIFGGTSLWVFYIVAEALHNARQTAKSLSAEGENSRAAASLRSRAAQLQAVNS